MLNGKLNKITVHYFFVVDCWQK